MTGALALDPDLDGALNGAPAPPDDDGIFPEAGTTTPPLAVEIYERAIAAEGFDAIRRWPPPRKMGMTLHTTAWNVESGHQLTLIWYTSPDAEFRWTFDRLVEIFDHRTFPYLNHTAADVPGVVASFFGDPF